MEKPNIWQFLVRYWQGLEAITFTCTFSRNKTFLKKQKMFKRTHHAIYKNEKGDVVQIGPERNFIEDAQTDLHHWKKEHQTEESSE